MERQRFEPPPLPQRPAAPANEPPRPGPPLSARERLLNARTSPAAPLSREGLRGLRDVVHDADDLGAASAKAAQSARDTRDSYGTTSPQQFQEDDEAPAEHDRIEPRFDDDEALSLEDESPPLRSPEPSHDFEDEDEEPALSPPFPRSQAPRTREPEDELHEPRRPRSYRGLAKLAVVLIILAGLGATISWRWSHINGLYQFISHMRSRQTQTAQAPAAEPKFPGRVPQEQIPGQTPGAGTAPGSQALPAVAQRVVLYEEDQNDPQGKRFVGSAIWRTETVSPGPGLAPELAVRADIEVPDRHMTVTWSLRRNTDQALPASHTIEIMFNLPPDFPGGSIANVPGVLMKAYRAGARHPACRPCRESDQWILPGRPLGGRRRRAAQYPVAEGPAVVRYSDRLQQWRPRSLALEKVRRAIALSPTLSRPGVNKRSHRAPRPVISTGVCK